MSIKRLKIKGLRGFLEETNIDFAIPDGKTYGSGLTVLVGPNNSGKSTVIEAINILSSNSNVIPLSSRNSKLVGKIEIEATDTLENKYSVKSLEDGGAFIERRYNGILKEENSGIFNELKVFVLSNKRNIVSSFSNNYYQDRDNYRGNVSDDYRDENNHNNNFGGRLLTISKNRKAFDDVLKKVLSPLPEWKIEATDNSNVYLDFSFNGVHHSSKGAGDGFINIFNIVDSLYDSEENNIILIDEPEVSLHPDLLRKLLSLLAEYSKDKQIILSTHSPYLVDWKLFSESAKILRLKKKEDSIKVYGLNEARKEEIKNILEDKNNIHTLSLDANEIFFMNDNVILTEGQDDVICYREIFKKYNYTPNASLFGWGVGGSGKTKFIINILKDLGYEKVFTIFDNNKIDEMKKLEKIYPNYKFYAIKADDVRNKEKPNSAIKLLEDIEKLEIEEDTKIKIKELIDKRFKEILGLVKNKETFEINKEYEEDILNLIESLKSYFSEEKEDENVGKEKLRQGQKQEKNKEEKIEERKEENEKNEDKEDSYIEYLEEQKARKLLENWLKDNKMTEYVQKKYKKLNICSGGGGELSFKKYKEGIYYCVIEQSEGLAFEEKSITINYLIKINLKKNKVKIKKKKVVSNTLPI